MSGFPFPSCLLFSEHPLAFLFLMGPSADAFCVIQSIAVIYFTCGYRKQGPRTVCSLPQHHSWLLAHAARAVGLWVPTSAGARSSSMSCAPWDA